MALVPGQWSSASRWHCTEVSGMSVPCCGWIPTAAGDSFRPARCLVLSLLMQSCPSWM